jgi:hypothetical protein
MLHYFIHLYFYNVKIKIYIYLFILKPLLLDAIASAYVKVEHGEIVLRVDAAAVNGNVYSATLFLEVLAPFVFYFLKKLYLNLY